MFFLPVSILLFLSSCHCDEHSFQPANPKRSFTVNQVNHVFMKDGAPFQYVSGSIHYSRIPKAYWGDRLYKMKAAGLDAIQIYVPWNFHQPEEGVFDFTGDRNLTDFLNLALSLDLLVIARVGPYICAEWDFGGLPAWLLRLNPLMRLRSSDPDYMQFVRRWFSVLLPSIKPLLYENGGPIIMVQLENEYALIPVPEAFGSVEKFRANQPWVNSEYYVGWLDVWNGIHNRVDPTWASAALNHLISYSDRVNVNIYMFHGGTNFGFWNGGARPRPSITSYDYDAPISEAGDITWKYMIFRELFFQRKGVRPPKLPRNNTKISYGRVEMKFKSHLLATKGPVTRATFPVYMERLSQYNGYMIYSVPLRIDRPKSLLVNFSRISDIAHIFTGNNSGYYTYHGSLEYTNHTFSLDNANNIQNITIITENIGHINFGNDIYSDIKGIIGPDPFMINSVYENEQNLVESKWPIHGRIYNGIFIIKELGDTFIHPESFARHLQNLSSGNEDSIKS
ncbi:unnamed protein product [Heterobilharzia americana]|nr:unnamed protein product [Heterobilharzia americana]